MRYLNKIVFINSAHVPYSEVRLDGNVHFIGTQGVGKSTILRALLFFYNADKLKLGIPQEKKGFDSFYFPYENSYIIYEVMRESGAYCIMTFRYLGRAAYRFIDAPYDKDWFVDGRNQARADWFEIRERIGKERSVSAIITIYETFRDIIFGNNRRQELMGYRKYAIVESPKYQNIPRTIQNVFLNSKLDADFIKDTIIRSMTDDDVSIDLDYFRNQTKEFEQEYRDVMLWQERNKNGEVPVRKAADKVMGSYRDLIYVRKQIEDGRAELNHAEKTALMRLPKLREDVADSENKRLGIVRMMNELEQKRAKERDEINMNIGRVDADLKRAAKKRQEYALIGIEEVVRRVSQEAIVEKELERVQAQKSDLTRAYQDVMAKYRQLMEAEEVGFRSFENDKQKQILTRQDEARRKHEEAMNNLRQEEERVRDASSDKERNADERLQQLRDSQTELRQQLVKLQYEVPFGKEIAAIEEELSSLGRREAELNAAIRESQMTIAAMRSECDMRVEALDREYEKKIDAVRRDKAAVMEALAALDGLLERRKGSFAEWLEHNKPGWEDTVGKVADEETVLYSSSLNPRLTDTDGSLFGVEVDLTPIERNIRTPEQLGRERAERQQEADGLSASLTRLAEEREAETGRLRKKFVKQIREAADKQHLLEAENTRIPVRVKNLKADLSSWRTKTEEWRRKQNDAVQDKLNESGRQIYLAEEDKKRLADERDRQLKSCQKQYRDRLASIKAETDRLVAEVNSEIEERRRLHRMRLHSLEGDRDAELSGKGGDMAAIRKCDAQIESLRRDMDYIREHRKIVANYETDKEELFDREPAMKSRKKELEDKLAALDARYALRAEKYKLQLRQVDEQLLALRRELQSLEDGLRKADNFRKDSTLCPDGSMDVGERLTRKGCAELVDELTSGIVSATAKMNEFKKTVALFTGYFSAKNTFHFRTELVGEDDYFDFASNLCEFVDNNKIADFQRQISERYTRIITRISTEVGQLTRNKGEISKTIEAVNRDFVERNFSGVIKEIALRQTQSSDRLMQLLLEIKKFTDENQYNMGEANLFTQSDREEVNAGAVKYLLAFMKCLTDDPSRGKLQLSDTFNLEFRVKENDNDTGWVEKIANVGSDGTDILVKAMVNIMLINVFKERASRKSGDFKLHCMMDEIGKLHPNNIRGILEFANCRNILLVNGSPTTYIVGDYRHTYLLTKDAQSNTKIVPLVTHD